LKFQRDSYVIGLLNSVGENGDVVPQTNEAEEKAASKPWVRTLIMFIS
jgi:hypothetical protein